jgi:diguanylate cyclase (GGDEF)-like protein
MAEAQSSILIVDDDAEDLSSVERSLRSLGSEIFSIKDPHEVMPGVHRHRPDVVIVDALLPGLSGFDLCKQIKSDPQLKGTQVLILTGVYLRQQYRHEAIQQFKADAFLTKPFRPPELQRLVVQLLSRKTRMPQSSFLKRIGLPASSEPKRKGLLGRIFGRSEAEEAATNRIAPMARDLPPAPAAEGPSPVIALGPPPRVEAPPKAAERPPAPLPPVVEDEEVKSEAEAPAVVVAPAPAVVEEPPNAKARLPEPRTEEVSPEPRPEPETGEPPESEAPPGPETIAIAKAPSPEPTPAREEPLPSDPPEEVQSSVEAGAAPTAEVDREPPPETDLDAPPPSDEAEDVTWVQSDSRTQEMTLEAAAARVAEAAQPPSAFEDLVAARPTELETESSEEGVPAADSPQTMRRPLFRVGEVPIYEEPDFLTELKRELSKCKRVDRPLTLILIRVGDLGQIIELFGKDFRERVLWHIAEQAMESLREVDLVGMMSSMDLIAMTAFASDRYGGGRIVSRMRQAVSRKPFRVGDELPPIIPALDFGMATFPTDGSEVSSLMRRAEEDLRNGQDRAAVTD